MILAMIAFVINTFKYKMVLSQTWNLLTEVG